MRIMKPGKVKESVVVDEAAGKEAVVASSPAEDSRDSDDVALGVAIEVFRPWIVVTALVDGSACTGPMRGSRHEGV